MLGEEGFITELTWLSFLGCELKVPTGYQALRVRRNSPGTSSRNQNQNHHSRQSYCYFLGEWMLIVYNLQITFLKNKWTSCFSVSLLVPLTLPGQACAFVQPRIYRRVTLITQPVFCSSLSKLGLLHSYVADGQATITGVCAVALDPGKPWSWSG